MLGQGKFEKGFSRSLQEGKIREEAAKGGRILERIETEVLFRNPWHAYRRDRVRRRDGSEGDYFYVDHPSSVAVIGSFRDETVLVQRTFRYLFGRWLPQVVLGHTRPEEDQLEEARRELREETGFLAEELVHLGDFTPYSGVSNEVCHVFLARDLVEVGADPEPTEEMEVLRLPREEARSFLFSGPLLDGQSLSAWALYEAWLAGGSRERGKG